jgi:hypothetical protein
MFESFAAYETTSIESGGGGDVQQRTGDLGEVGDKQFQTIEAPKAYSNVPPLGTMAIFSLPTCVSVFHPRSFFQCKVIRLRYTVV